jgi:cell division septation protein DedD
MFARALIVLLVMLNLGVALWWATRVDATGDDAALEQPAGVARLQLASEAPARIATGPAPAPEDTGAVERSAVPASGRCFTLGPFADADAASAARAALPATVLRVRQREAAPATAAWRVMMPALADRDAATAMAERLRQAGFRDLFVVADGAEANSIALGRFGGETAARRHVEALREAGFEAQAEAIGSARQHWLDVAVADEAAAAGLRAVSGVARVDAIDCSRLG